MDQFVYMIIEFQDQGKKFLKNSQNFLTFFSSLIGAILDHKNWIVNAQTPKSDPHKVFYLVVTLLIIIFSLF